MLPFRICGIGYISGEERNSMTDRENQPPIVIAEHASGSVSDSDALNQEITKAWATLISNPTKKAEIARALGMAEGELRSDNPPFSASGGPSGVIETTILILLAKGFLGGVGAAAGKATFEYLQSLWKELAEPLEDPRPQAIGAAKELQPTGAEQTADDSCPRKENAKPTS
jgi:hypothetical protein